MNGPVRRAGRRRLVRGLALVAAGLLGALALALFGVYPQEPLRRLVEARLRTTFGPARLGRLHLVAADLRADIEDLTIETPTFVLRIPRARLRFSAAALLGKGMILRGAEIERPDLVVRPADAPTQSPTPPPSAAEAPVVVESVTLSGGSFSYRDPTLGGDVVLQRIEANGSLGRGALTLTAAAGAWARPEPLTIGPVRAVLRVSPLFDLRLDRLEVRARGSSLEASGDLGRPGAWKPDVEARADLNLAELGVFLGTKRLDGSVHTRLHLAGTLDRPRVEMNATSPHLVIEGWGVQGPEVEASLTDQEAKATLRAALLGGHLSAETRLRLGAPSQPARFARPPLEGWLQVVSLDAARLAQALGTMSDPAPVAARLGGRLTWSGDPKTTVALRGRLDAEAPNLGGLSATAHAEAVGNLHVPSRAVDLAWSMSLGADRTAVVGSPQAPSLEQLRLEAAGAARGPFPPDVEGDAEGTAVVRGNGARHPIPLHGFLAMKGDGTRIEIGGRGLEGTMRASVQRAGGGPARLTLDAETLQLDRLIPQVGGRFSASLDATGPVGRPSGRAQGRIEGLTWRGADLGDLGARLQGHDGSAELSAELPALHALARGRLTLGDAPAFSGDITLAEAPLGVFAPALLPNRELTGAVTARVEVQVPLAAPGEAKVQGQVEHLEVASKPWQFATSQPFDWGYAKGRLTLKDLEVEGSGLRLSSRGSIGASSEGDLDVQAAVTADLEAVPLPEGWHGEGSITAQAHLTGTLSRPLAAGEITCSSAAVSGPGMPPLQIAQGRIGLQGDHAETTDLTATLADGSLRLSAMVPFTRPGAAAPPGSGPVKLRVGWDGLQASALAAALRPSGTPAIQGALSGELQVEGPSWASLRGTARSAAIAGRLDELPLEIAPFALQIDATHLATDGIIVSSEGASFTTSGSVDLRSRGLDVKGKGMVDLRALSPLATDTGLSGTADIDVSLGGTLDAPRPRGRVRVQEGTVRLRTLAQALTAVEGALVFDDTHVTLETVSASFGGGRIDLSGGAGLAGASLADVDVKVQGRDLSLRYPEGLSTRLDLDLSLGGRSGALQLAGTVNALRGLCDLDAALRQSATPVPPPQESALLRQIGLDVAMRTATPIRVRGDLADFRMGGSLRIRGDMQEPAPFGRLEIERAGRLKLQEGDFDISSGWLLYEGNWDPRISLEAQQRENDIARAGAGSRVAVSLQGTLAIPTLTVRSEGGISAMGQTGLTLSGATADNSARLVGGQAASLLADRMTGGVKSQLKSLGFDEVTIEPQLLVRETERVGARFTFRKNLTRRVDLLYSLSLNNPEDRFIRLDTRPIRNVTVFGQREDVGSFTAGAGQRIRLGGAKRTTERGGEARVRIEEVRFEGTVPLPEAGLRKAVRARAGRRVTTWDVQEDSDRLRRLLREANFLEAEVSGRLDGAVATYEVRPGLPYGWRVEGLDKPPALERELRAALFEEEALDRGRAVLLRTLQDRGHLRASVTSRAVTEAGSRILVLTAHPGPQYRGAEAVFPGATSVGHGELLRAAGGMTLLLSAPARAADGLRALYQQRHFLKAQVDAPQFTERESELVISTAIHEGPRASIATVAFQGTSVPAEELTKALALPLGSPPEEGSVEAAVQRVRELYLTRGYAAVRVVPRLRAQDTDYSLVLEVQEGDQLVVGSAEFVGLHRTRASLVRSRVDLKPGEPLDPRKLSELERKLLDLGVFSSVYTSIGAGSPAAITVTVEEDARVVAGYDFRYNQNDRASARGDLELRNIFGRGLTMGGRYTVGTDLRESRGSIHVPSIGPSGDLTFSVFRLDEDLPAGDGTILRVQKGIELQGKRRLPNRWNLLYGYRFRRVGITDFVPISLASLDVSLLRDSRDNVLDPRRGHFWGLNVEVSPRRIGSDNSYLKGFAQASFVQALVPRLFWAHGYRVGLAHVFDREPLFSSERFTAGGANTLRGFATDSLGPRSALDVPTGGQAVLVLNQELRWDAHWGLGAVAFYDGGNVFASVRDLGFDLRHVLGAGLRWRSPVGVVRFDLGFPLAREAGERKYRVFLSLGQAF